MLGRLSWGAVLVTKTKGYPVIILLYQLDRFSVGDFPAPFPSNGGKSRGLVNQGSSDVVVWRWVLF
jgi:hypothetical protein